MNDAVLRATVFAMNQSSPDVASTLVARAWAHEIEVFKALYHRHFNFKPQQEWYHTMKFPEILKWKVPALSGGLAFTLFTLTLPAFAGTPINKIVHATTNGNVNISSMAGNIKVTAWNRDHIHIGGTLSRDAQRLAVAKTATGVTIRVVLPYCHSCHMEGSHLILQVPASSHLEVHTVSADIDSDGLTGSVRLESVSGNLSVASRSADIEAKTISGDVTVSGSAPNATIEAHSVSGEIRIGEISGNLHASSTSGDIQLAATVGPNDNYVFQSVNGNIILSLPRVPEGSFDVSSFRGGIDTNFGPTPQRTGEFGPGKEWHYQSGSGNAHIRIYTQSGNIRIHASAH